MKTTSNPAPADEILVSITNIILRSKYGKIFFPDTITGEENFDKWQAVLLECSRLIHQSWYDDTEICENALDVFERAFSAIFAPAIKEAI